MDFTNPKSPETRYSIRGIEEAIFNCMDATNSGEIDDEIFIVDRESSETRKFYGYIDDEADRSETEIFSRETEDGDEFNLFSTMDSSETGNFAVETEEFETGFNSFKNFDITHEPPDDHHFFKHQKDSSRVHALGQKIKQEWNLLKEKLPNSIFVRVYESRVLQEPPKNFEDFVKEHFRKRADSILVKFTQEFDGIKDQPMIIDLFTDLYKSLERNGTSCVDHLCFLKSSTGNHAVEESKNEGHLMKIARRLKNLID
ncbi:unnamed protein product [Fraxinus pennsylvanica]|uniref:Uncharacterized protein n=1 Tax=Fraxinus pennsylvanica TaxID=56036 RepID=A0AAD2A435_9LAMI|nr:unnamed protein product [Fraxinus pennsylvanica]